MQLADALSILKPNVLDRIQRTNQASSLEAEALNTIQQSGQDVVATAATLNRLAFSRLSYEQTLKLNSWWTGCNINLDFDSNRSGKTAGALINAILWMIPNDPTYRIYTPHTDPYDREIILLSRPPIENIRRIRTILREANLYPDYKLPFNHPTNEPIFSFLLSHSERPLKPAYPLPPISQYGEHFVWQGCPDLDWHKDITYKEWIKWLPDKYVSKTIDYKGLIELKIPASERFIPWTIIPKSYDSKETKFSGKAIDGIILSEGPPEGVLNEVKQRFIEHCFGSWDFTPYEAKNTDSTSHLAYKFFTQEQSLPGQSAIFSGFGVYKVPDYILPPGKKAEMIEQWEGKPEGLARISGQFFTSSPAVLSNLSDPLHTLTNFSFSELREKFPRLKLVRGIDPGINHPTVCVWGALNELDQWFIYRAYIKTDTTIEERTKDIITLSKNTRLKVPWGWKENQSGEKYAASFIDYHTWKRDEVTRQPYVTNYIREGLALSKSIGLGPQERGQQFNNKLAPVPTLPHPITGQLPGARIYFLLDEPGVPQLYAMLKNVLWGTVKSGTKKGDPTDKVQELDDDEFDAAGYVVLSPLEWKYLNK